jgi:DNA-binding beta-propeller fold protein YncE
MRAWSAARRVVFLLVFAFLPALTSAAGAEEMREVWRSPFGAPSAVSVNTHDGSVWAATGASLMHLSARGETLSQTDGFWGPTSVSANPVDGTCWVVDTPPWGVAASPTVIHLAADGTRMAVYSGLSSPTAVVVDPTDGSCWVADRGPAGVAHLSVASEVLWQSGDLGGADAVSVDPGDGSLWVGTAAEVVHLEAEGTVLSRSPVAGHVPSVSVDLRDGSCWAAVIDQNDHNDYVVHLSSTGAVLWRSSAPPQFFGPLSVWVSPVDGSCLVADTQHNEVVMLGADGTERWRVGGMSLPMAATVDPTEGAVYVADGGSHQQVVKLQADGSGEWRRGAMSSPWDLSVDPRDGSCWVADVNNHRVVRLAESGAETIQVNLASPMSVSVDVADDSCWIGDAAGHRLVHVAADGAESWRGGYGALIVRASPRDGSCWLAERSLRPVLAYQIVHLSAEGAELWRGGSLTSVAALAVNSRDGSCWVADELGNRVVHLTAGGHELWGGDIDHPIDLSADPNDGSCWVANRDAVLHLASGGMHLAEVFMSDTANAVAVDQADGSCWVVGGSELTHLASDGSVLLTQPAASATSLAVNSADGTCWVASSGQSQVAHFAPPSYRAPTFSDVPSTSWAFRAVEACSAAGLVSGFGDGRYEPALVVTRDQMAVFLARALDGGDAYVPTSPAEVSFSDVPADYWAYKYVEEARAQGLVTGYWDGYHPTEEVTRAQMAVFVARAIATPTGEAGLVAYTPPTTASFPDVPTDYWAYKHIEYCKAHAIVSGYCDGYHPEEAVTRAQMAVYVTRAFKLPM